jgi:transcriptional regulator with XRE-family HTH domain
MSIHVRIKQRRTALFPSQEAFARELDLNYGMKVAWQSVQQWEKEDGTAPTRRRMPSVAAALKTTPEWLLYGTGVEDVTDADKPQQLKAVAPPPPKWMDEEAFRLLDLYYSLNERKRGEVRRLLEGIRPEDSARAAGGER